MESQVLTTAGANYNVQPQNQKNFTLGELENIVNGKVGMLRLSSTQIMVFNNKAKEQGLSYNPHATLIAVVARGGTIFGDVLLCEPQMLQS
jgi:hypothetical protein